MPRVVRVLFVLVVGVGSVDATTSSAVALLPSAEMGLLSGDDDNDDEVPLGMFEVGAKAIIARLIKRNTTTLLVRILVVLRFKMRSVQVAPSPPNEEETNVSSLLLPIILSFMILLRTKCVEVSFLCTKV